MVPAGIFGGERRCWRRDECKAVPMDGLAVVDTMWNATRRYTGQNLSGTGLLKRRFTQMNKCARGCS